VAGCGVFLGLSALTVTLLRAEGLPLQWVNAVRLALIAGASLWSLWLAVRIGGRYTPSRLGRTASALCAAVAIAIADLSPVFLFWVW
jgi:hypothetical protein